MKRLVSKLTVIFTALGCGLFAFSELAKAETKTVEFGNIRADFSFSVGQYCRKNPRLTLMRNGVTVFNQRVSDEDFCLLNNLEIRDLDGDKEPEVIANVYSGSAHCCTSSLIYRYDKNKQQYTYIKHYWGNNNRVKIEDLDKDGSLEFNSYDDRFSYKFSSFAFSRYPLQIWKYSQGKMIDVTRRYPQLIKNNAYKHWQEYVRNKSNPESKAILAAYLADKYLLGEEEDGWQRLRENYRQPDREQFFQELANFLEKTGYSR